MESQSLPSFCFDSGFDRAKRLKIADCDDDYFEDLPAAISNYYFVNDNEEPISFSVLPITQTSNEVMQGGKKHVYMHGKTDGELRKIFKQAIAWTFDLSEEKPTISVLSKEKNWIKLQKPRKSYEEIIRTDLITVNFLHLLKRNPKLSGEVIWDTLSRICSSYDNRPCVNDLVDRKALIKEAVKQDESLTKSKYLKAFLKEKLLMEKITDEDALTREKRMFIVDDNGSSENEDSSSDDENSSSEEQESVCSICDNGGTLLACKGICMRSFHPTKKAANEVADTPKSRCVSLGFSEKEVKDMPIFKCKNCLYQRHQCFCCGKLGSSEKSSADEVFQCVNATCGYFYHPRCVAKLLNREILAGEPFTCPLHICSVCKNPEDKRFHKLQMAVCRRCPKAYHRKCLPRDITFEENKIEGIIKRAWPDLLVDRILIYCPKHIILKDLNTPERNHIKFPDDEKREEQLSALEKDNIVSKRKNPSVGTGTAIHLKETTTEARHLHKRIDGKFLNPRGPEIITRELLEEIFSGLRADERNHIKFPVNGKREEHQSLAVALKEDNVVSTNKRPSVGETCHTGTAIQSDEGTVEYSHMDKRNDRKNSKLKGSCTTRKLPNEKNSCLTKVDGSSRALEHETSLGDWLEHDIKKSKLKGSCTIRKLHNEKNSCLTKVDVSSRALEHETSLGDWLFEFYSPLLDSEKPSKSHKPDEGKLTKTSKHGFNKVCPQSDSGSEQRILDLMKEASSKINLPDVIKQYGKPTSFIDSDKTIRQGEVERFCEVLKALYRLVVQNACKPTNVFPKNVGLFELVSLGGKDYYVGMSPHPMKVGLTLGVVVWTSFVVIAIRTAVRKLSEGGSIEDAKAICEPMVLNKLDYWKEKLCVYLAPFLPGSCYTSVGRHFCKVDKLKEIVDKVHSFVKDGDTIVDFCCGANDFSWLLKEKLEQMDIQCSYKNYDLYPAKSIPYSHNHVYNIPPFLVTKPEATQTRTSRKQVSGNDFNVEVRSWFTVEPHELPSGSQLIMGLNPPFGDRGQCANKFFDHALKFKPKLLILITPMEAKRLDKRKTHPYDLILEDNIILSGKSFDLPDVSGKQVEDGNIVAPVLSLWSHPDWTHTHKAIADKLGQLRSKSVHNDGKAVGIEIDHDAVRQKEPVTNRKADYIPGNRARENQDTRKTDDHKRRSNPNDHDGRKEGNQDLRRRRRSSEEEHRREGTVKNLPKHKKHRGSPSHYDHRAPCHFPQHSSRHQDPHLNYEKMSHRNQASYHHNRPLEVDGLASRSRIERELVAREPWPSNYSPQNTVEWTPGEQHQSESGQRDPRPSNYSPQNTVDWTPGEQHQSKSGYRDHATFSPENQYMATARMMEPYPPRTSPPEMGPTAGAGFSNYQASRPRGYSGDPTMGFAYGPVVNSSVPGSSGGWLSR